MINKLIWVTLFLIGCAIFSGCEDSNCKDAPSQYEFVTPITISPAKDTFHVGDTILVESVFSDMVRNRVDDKTYHLVSYHFLPLTVLKKIDAESSLSDFNQVEFLIDPSYNYFINTSSSSADFLEGEYTYSNNEYRLVYRLVVLSPGTYLLYQGNELHLDEYGRSQRFPGKCDKKGVYAVSLVNNGADNNIHLLQDSPDASILRILQRPQGDFHDNGGYAFVVVE